jgi:hypothetical protein
MRRKSDDRKTLTLKFASLKLQQVQDSSFRLQEICCGCQDCPGLPHPKMSTSILKGIFLDFFDAQKLAKHLPNHSLGIANPEEKKAYKSYIISSELQIPRNESLEVLIPT